MDLVSRSRRSELYLREDGMLVRRYVDTGRWGEPYPAKMDEAGRVRGPGNRVIATAGPSDARAYRGSAKVERTPEFLRRALSVLSTRPVDVDAFATGCGVARTTAWGYACRVVERWPHSSTNAQALVHPSLLEACRATNDLSGSLRELGARLPICGDADMRCLEDRYAHLRLARLCVLAARED